MAVAGMQVAPEAHGRIDGRQRVCRSEFMAKVVVHPQGARANEWTLADVVTHVTLGDAERASTEVDREADTTSAPRPKQKAGHLSIEVVGLLQKISAFEQCVPLCRKKNVPIAPF